MRVVRSEAELEDALAAAKREAEAAFGDGTVFCERYLERPRHVEAQLLGARRRRRRSRRAGLLDSAPSSEAHRGVARRRPRPERLAEDRRRRRRVRGGDRLQGRRHGRVPGRRLRRLLPRAQRPDPGGASGHRGGDGARHRRAAAPGRRRRAGRARGRSPEVTRSRRASTPRTRSPSSPRPARSAGSSCLPAIRVDAGVEEGDEIGLSYDPLIAKLIAHGADRDDAIARLERRTRCDGRRWRHDQPPVPALARAPSGVPRGLGLDRLPS